MDYGYSRCSTNETKPDINRQVRELKAAGAEQIFVEYEHGDAKVKSQQQAMFAEAQAGDTIIVLEASRLARSTQQLCEIIDLVREKHLRLVIVGSITLDCRNGQADPMSEAFLQMAGVFSQLELAMIRSRVRSGMESIWKEFRRRVLSLLDYAWRYFGTLSAMGLLLGVLGMGLYSRRYLRDVTTFLSAGRVCGRYVIAVGEISAALSIIGLLAYVEVHYKTGFALSFWNAVMTPLSILLSLYGFCMYRFRETKAQSIGQFLEMRYSRKF